MADGQEHWWVVHVAMWMQIAGFVIFGGGFLYAFVLGPAYGWLTSRGNDDSEQGEPPDLRVVRLHREMMGRREPLRFKPPNDQS